MVKRVRYETHEHLGSSWLRGGLGSSRVGEQRGRGWGKDEGDYLGRLWESLGGGLFQSSGGGPLASCDFGENSLSIPFGAQQH